MLIKIFAINCIDSLPIEEPKWINDEACNDPSHGEKAK